MTRVSSGDVEVGTSSPTPATKPADGDAPAAVTSDEEDGFLQDRAVREHFSDGLERITRDKEVSDTTRKKIAGLRSTVLFCVHSVLTATFLIVLMVGIDVGEVLTTSTENAELDLCGGSQPAVTNTLEELASKRHRQIRFVPTAADTAEMPLALPEIDYFESEDWKSMTPANKQLLLSLGLFTLSPLKVQVSLHNASCVDASKKGTDVVTAMVGQALTAAVKTAGRRAVKIAPTKGLPLSRGHGGVLIQIDTDHMFDVDVGKFTREFIHSEAWDWLMALLLIMLVVLTAYLSTIVGRIVFVEWESSVMELVLQYDYLWELDHVRLKTIKHHAKIAAGSSNSIRKTILEHMRPSFFERNGVDISDGEMFKSVLSTCTPFFVLDHVIGNVWQNADSYKYGAASAALQGLLLGVLPILCVLAAVFCEELRIPVVVLLVGHWLVSITFGILYFFYVHFKYRWPFLYMLLFTLAVISLGSITYFVAVMLFLSTQIVQSPEEVIKIVLPIASILFYVVVVTHRLADLRVMYKDFVENQDKPGKKGAVSEGWNKLALSTRWLSIAIVCSVIVLLFFAVLLACATSVYTDPAIDGDVWSWAPAAVMPITSVVKTWGDIGGKEKEIENETKSKLDKFGKLL